MRARELEMYANAQPKQYQHRAAEEVCSDRVCHAPSRALTGMLTISSAMSMVCDSTSGQQLTHVLCWHMQHVPDECTAGRCTAAC